MSVLIEVAQNNQNIQRILPNPLSSIYINADETLKH